MESYHMSPDEFRKQGKQMIDWIADYYENLEKYPVLSQVKPGEIKAQLPETAPINATTVAPIITAFFITNILKKSSMLQEAQQIVNTKSINRIKEIPA